MCGRYTLAIDKNTIEHRFGAKFYIAASSYDGSSTFNAAPSQIHHQNLRAKSHRARALGLLAGGMETQHALTSNDQRAPRDRGR
jgi:putative SOS response-associated peptidase YedK